MGGGAGLVGGVTVRVLVAAVELGPPEAACVAVIVWLALLNGEVGVKLQALLTTAAVPATVPSIEMVTVSPLDRESGVEGKRVGLGGARIVKKKKVGTRGGRRCGCVGWRGWRWAAGRGWWVG